MRIIVCDDCPHELDDITSLLKDCRYKSSFSLLGFNEPKDVLDHLKNGAQPDVVFLNTISGIDLAEKIRSHGFVGSIVFLSATNNFAVQAYKVKAFSYLLKPARKSEIQKVLDEIEKSRAVSDNSGFKLTWKGGGKFVFFSELTYVEVREHHLFFHLQSGEIIRVYGKLNAYKEILLADPRMYHSNRSFILNMDYVSKCDEGAAFLKDGTRISIPRQFEQFKSDYFDRRLGRV